MSFEEEKQKSKMKENRKARNKKNKLEEINKPRGYDRGLEIEKICGSTDCTGTLQFLVKWHQCDELDLIQASEIADNDPNFLILFYEERCPLNTLAKDRKPMYYPLDPPILSSELPPSGGGGGDIETDAAVAPVESTADTDSTIIELTAEQEQQLLTTEISAVDSSDIAVEMESPAFTYEIAPPEIGQQYTSMPTIIDDAGEYSAVVQQNY